MHVLLSAPVPASRPRLPDARQPHRHGLHAHAARVAGPADRAHRPLLRRARQGRGRADHHRRVLAQRGRADGAGRAHLQRDGADRGASAGDGRRARGGRQDRAADPACRALRQDRRRGRALHHRLADQSERASPHERGRHPAHHRGLRHDRGAGARGRLRRRRDHGLGRLSHQRVHRAAHQRPHRCLGRQPGEPAAPGHRDHGRGARTRGARFPRHLPRVLDRPGPGRPDRRGDRRRGAAPSRPPAPTSSTRASAGTRRACRPSPRRCRARPGRSRRAS